MLVDFLRGRWSTSENLPMKLTKFLFLLNFKMSSEEIRNLSNKDMNLFTKMLYTHYQLADKPQIE